MADHSRHLVETIAALRPLVGTLCTQIVAGAASTAPLRKLVKELRATFARLATHMDNLRDDLPELATRYEQAREIVDAGRGALTPRRQMPSPCPAQEEAPAASVAAGASFSLGILNA